ncbi:hypothetical protein IQ238_25025 [Pleurocapsales cyanobacterium LEGE 06147]|nr:hypothetical protein [Pleurocapsales cyanobacterium LEGE 06147]
MFNQKIVSLLSISAFATVLGGQVAQAETVVKNDTNLDKQPNIELTSSILEPATDINNFEELTSASTLNSESSDTADVAQIDDIEVGTPTRSSPSYLGVGGNIGLGGGPGIGQAAFTVFSKLGLLPEIAFRPSVIIGDDVAVLLPLTYDFAVQEVVDGEFSLAPYIGGGLAIGTGDDGAVGGLITSGVDVGISPRFTANAQLNVGFIDGADVGLILGLGYNFFP